MSTTTLPNARPEIDGLLANLKSRIRTYVLIEGIALVVCLLCLAFWVAYLVDYAYFAVRRLELPVWLRMGYAIGVVGLLVFVLLAYLVFRLVRKFRAKALALVLEKRFPELDDRLITAVEMSESPPQHETELSKLMLARTVQDVVRDSSSLEIADVFDKKPLVRAVVAGAVLLAATTAFCYANPDGADRFRKAFLGFEDEYWDRETKLLVRVVSQPGDVVKDFRYPEGHEKAGLSTGGEPGVYKHPKGSPLSLRILVPAGSVNFEGNPWVVPEKDKGGVRVSYVQEDGKGGNDPAPQSEDETLEERENARAVFVYERDSVTESLDLWVTGNDYTNRTPYRIEVVEPPQIDATTFDCDFPAYTGWNAFESERRRRVSGKTHALPEETRFVYETTTNKQIVGARLVFGDTELAFGPKLDENGRPVPDEFQGTVRVEEERDGSVEWDEKKLDPAAVANFVRTDGMGFRVPFVVSRQLTDAAKLRAAETFRDLGVPFVLAPGTRVRIYLSDADGIESIDPATLTVDGVEDATPVFDDLAKRAIDRHITNRARIPFTGKVLDDYGIAKGHFEFRVERSRKQPQPGEEPAPPVEASWLVRKFETFPTPLAGLPEGQNRILATSVTDEKERESWFLELVGPREQVADVADDVKRFLRGVRKIDGKLGWTLPKGWKERADGENRRIRVGDSSLEIVARRQDDLPNDFDAFILFHVNKWRSRIQLDDLKPEELEDEAGFETARGKNGEAAFLVDFSVEYPRVLPLGGDAPPVEEGASVKDLVAERFDVRPLELKAGNRLIITVYASDGDDLNGPHGARSTEFEFEIVDESDLQAMLYGRELDLLEQLKQVIKEVTETRDALVEKETVAGERDGLLDGSADALKKLDDPLGFTAERSLHQVRTSAGECRAIENSYREIAEELSNNDIDERQIKVMRETVVDPLAKANDELFPELDKALGAFKVGLEDGTKVADDVAEGILDADALLAVLEKVAQDLEDRVSYLRFYRDLKGILEGQEGLKGRTEKQQAEDLIDDLKKLEGLQD